MSLPKDMENKDYHGQTILSDINWNMGEAITLCFYEQTVEMYHDH